MSDYLTRLDRETWFDQVPSHPLPHKDLIEARLTADIAWQDYHRVLEREIHADTAEWREPDYIKIKMYLAIAEESERKYSAKYDELNGAK